MQLSMFWGWGWERSGVGGGFDSNYLPVMGEFCVVLVDFLTNCQSYLVTLDHPQMPGSGTFEQKNLM